jgi:hypothetical protein
MVLANEQETYWYYQGSETLIEINPNRAYTWLRDADYTQNAEVI